METNFRKNGIEMNEECTSLILSGYLNFSSSVIFAVILSLLVYFRGIRNRNKTQTNPEFSVKHV